MTSPFTEGPIAPPQPAAIPPKAAPINITASRVVTLSRKVIINIDPKAMPVKTRLKTQSLILPSFCERGIHKGTDSRGKQMAKIITGAHSGFHDVLGYVKR